MRRALALLSVVLAAFAAAAPGAAVARPQRALIFELHAGGFLVYGRSPLGSDRVRLLLDRHGEVAYYYVHAEIGARSVRARFGRLGSIDLRFAPEREGARACGGDEGWRRGTFSGAISFRGEHDYADVDAQRARGWMQTFPNECAGGSGSGVHLEVRRAGAEGRAGERAATPPGAHAIDGRAATRPAILLRRAQVAETGAILEAKTSPRLPSRLLWCVVENRPAGVRVSFNALREERREGMLIQRGAQVFGGESRFTWDLGAGTAELEPPAPFTGRARFRRGGAGRASWTGSLRVPVLGGAPMRLTGAAFAAQLHANP